MLSRMMTHLQAIQDKAQRSPALKSFLDKKGDEHCFSMLYLIAGVVCLYAAFVHGENFCTAPPAHADLQVASWAAAAGAGREYQSGFEGGVLDLRNGRRRLFEDGGEGGGEGGEATEEGGGEVGKEAAAVAEAGEGKEGGEKEEGKEGGEKEEGKGERDGDGGLDAAKGTEGWTVEPEIEDAFPQNSFVGPNGWVVVWLKVEGSTALGLPLLAIAMLLSGLHERECIACLLYLIATFQAGWLLVGGVFALGGFVPLECRRGEMGDDFAFHTMWWVCCLWLASTAAIIAVILCILCCLMGATAAAASSSGGKESYKPLEDTSEAHEQV